jgi:hypothetical protein
VNTELNSENLNVGDCMEYRSISWIIIFKRLSRTQDVKMWTRFMWPGIGYSGEL